MKQNDNPKKKPAFKISQTRAPLLRVGNGLGSQENANILRLERNRHNLSPNLNMIETMNEQNRGFLEIDSISAKPKENRREDDIIGTQYSEKCYPFKEKFVNTNKLLNFFKTTSQTSEEKEENLKVEMSSKRNFQQYDKLTSIARIQSRQNQRFNSVEPMVHFRLQKTKLSSYGDRELSMGRAKLTKLEAFYSDLNLSNSIIISTKSLNKSAFYRYFLNKYNNANLIRRCFLRRPWWKELPEDQIKRCHLVWTQYPIRQIYTRKKLFNFKENGALTSDFNEENFNPIQLIKGGKEAIGDDFKKIGLINLEPMACIMTNKMSHNVQYGHKSAMYVNLKHYCEVTKTHLFDLVPLSFYIDSLESPEYQLFKDAFRECQQNQPQGKNLWLVKPAEFTFGGNGIEICNSILDVEKVLKQKFAEITTHIPHKFILQKYIENPLLYTSRKFDIRAFCLLTCYNHQVKAYWHEEGYIRTTSQRYSLTDLDNLDVHLTNDCHQKTSKQYGQFENSNKLLYDQFFPEMESKLREQEVHFPIDASSSPGDSLRRLITDQMKAITVHLVRATAKKFEPNRDILSFELMGLDFMIDGDLKVLLIEANNSPSLSRTDNASFNSLLERVVEDVFQTAVDPIFQPPDLALAGQLQSNPKLSSKFQLIYDEAKDNSLDLGDPLTYGYQMT